MNYVLWNEITWLSNASHYLQLNHLSLNCIMFAGMKSVAFQKHNISCKKSILLQLDYVFCTKKHSYFKCIMFARKKSLVFEKHYVFCSEITCLLKVLYFMEWNNLYLYAPSRFLQLNDFSDKPIEFDAMKSLFIQTHRISCNEITFLATELNFLHLYFKCIMLLERNHMS